jgi:hypothetical protein
MEAYKRMVGSYNNQIVLEQHQRLENIYTTYSSHHSEAVGVLSVMKIVQTIINHKKHNKLIIAVVYTVNNCRRRELTTKAFYSPDFDVIFNIVKIR